MSQLIDIKVPDIGDYKDVPVIEVLVKAGDHVEKEQSIVVLESDKATMDVPSSHSGVVKEVKVKVGDSISEGTIVIVLEESGAVAAAPATAAGAVALPRLRVDGGHDVPGSVVALSALWARRSACALAG